MPFKTLTDFLKENGIEVSPTTLRVYMSGLSGGKKTRKPQKKKSIKKQNTATTEPSSSVQPAVEKKLPPRLARTSSGSY